MLLLHRHDQLVHDLIFALGRGGHAQHLADELRELLRVDFSQQDECRESLRAGQQSRPRT